MERLNVAFDARSLLPMFTPWNAHMALVFVETVVRAKACARVASEHVVEKSVFALLYGQHLLIVERFE